MAKDGKGLKASIWASRTRSFDSRAHVDTRSRSVPPATTEPSLLPRAAVAPAPPPPASSLTSAQAFHRFVQACQRLRWKFVDLQNSYERAVAPQDWGFTEQDAERNFKVDFHEFYVWIEQAIVLLLLVWGVVVPRGQDARSADMAASGAGGRAAASHAYHHNVLKALDEAPNNPLYEALGRGDVNHALWKAKELRNRWKDAAEGRETPPLKMYDLKWIVTQILGGLENAYGIAASWVEQEAAAAGAGMDEDAGVNHTAQDEGWDWMVEPMDWEA